MTYLDLTVACDNRLAAETLAENLAPLNVDITPRGQTVHVRAHGDLPEGMDVDQVLADHAHPWVVNRQEIG